MGGRAAAPARAGSRGPHRAPPRPRPPGRPRGRARPAPTASTQRRGQVLQGARPGLGLHPEHLAPRRRPRPPALRDRASISAAVLPAADCASARSRSLDDFDQVVRLTLPSSRPRHRVEHRHRGARVGAQAERVVLLGADDGRHPVGERQPEAVGAGLPLGVGEARREVDRVEGAQQRGVPAEPVQHQPVGVGEHQADRLVDQRAVQVGEHLAAALEEERLLVVGPGEDRLDRLQRHPVVLATAATTPSAGRRRPSAGDVEVGPQARALGQVLVAHRTSCGSRRPTPRCDRRYIATPLGPRGRRLRLRHRGSQIETHEPVAHPPVRLTFDGHQ